MRVKITDLIQIILRNKMFFLKNKNISLRFPKGQYREGIKFEEKLITEIYKTPFDSSLTALGSLKCKYSF